MDVGVLESLFYALKDGYLKLIKIKLNNEIIEFCHFLSFSLPVQNLWNGSGLNHILLRIIKVMNRGIF